MLYKVLKKKILTLAYLRLSLDQHRGGAGQAEGRPRSLAVPQYWTDAVNNIEERALLRLLKPCNTFSVYKLAANVDDLFR